MPVIAHSVVFDNPWLVVAVSVGGGGLAGQVAGVLNGDLGFMAKLIVAAGTALVIFGAIYFFAPGA